MRMRAEGNM